MGLINFIFINSTKLIFSLKFLVLIISNFNLLKKHFVIISNFILLYFRKLFVGGLSWETTESKFLILKKLGGVVFFLHQI